MVPQGSDSRGRNPAFALGGQQDLRSATATDAVATDVQTRQGWPAGYVIPLAPKAFPGRPMSLCGYTLW